MTFDLIFKDFSGSKDIIKTFLRTRIFLCSTNFLKMIIKKVRKLKLKEEIERTFLLCFTHLQNSTNVSDFNKYLGFIFQLFCLKGLDEITVNAYNELNNFVANKKLEESFNYECKENEISDLE